MYLKEENRFQELNMVRLLLLIQAVSLQLNDIFLQG